MKVKIVTVMPPPPLRLAFRGGGGENGCLRGYLCPDCISNKLEPFEDVQIGRTEMLYFLSMDS